MGGKGNIYNEKDREKRGKKREGMGGGGGVIAMKLYVFQRKVLCVYVCVCGGGGVIDRYRLGCR